MCAEFVIEISMVSDQQRRVEIKRMSSVLRMSGGKCSFQFRPGALNL
jgi:hypothetical protein